jgi:RNA 2',3'-cyclic 3'-phosphodiesterase
MRCFIAAWPDDAARARCGALIAELMPHAEHGRVMRSENLHLTFAFIGDLPDETGAEVAAACSRLTVEPVRWQLDQIGFFRRPRVLWAGGTAIAALDALAQRARALLDVLGIAYDRKPFVPHVTLLRDVLRYNGPKVIEPPIVWNIGEVALYRSGKDSNGARYFRVAA